ncbi:hypothetical protein [Campylobacter fetus]|uniref:hypothetical protein n=1 Tax=Campylobacter fetus TaxID=196 RepID=UPI00168D28E7|nr:hypothetical protein [Campylobacter fetus]MBD3866321.1 hypothetical protein [Campylobacter fetus]
MKVSQAYSIIALIFANNFAKAMNEENLKKLTNSWVIKTENIENEKRSGTLAKSTANR